MNYARHILCLFAICGLLMGVPFSSFAANKAWWGTGAGSGDGLAGEDGANLTVGDVGIVTASTYTALYYLSATGCDSGSDSGTPPAYIRPGANYTNKCWRIVPFGALIPEVDGHTTGTAVPCNGSTVYNTGQGASDVSLDLPAAAAGKSCMFVVGTTVAANKWRVRAAANDKIYLYGTDGSVTAGSDNGYVGYSASAKYPTIGHSFLCYTFKTDSYDWICRPLTSIALTAE